MTRRFFLSLFAALLAVPKVLLSGGRSFKSRWFAKPVEPIGNWAANGYFGTSQGNPYDELHELATREAGNRPPPPTLVDWDEYRKRYGLDEPTHTGWTE